MRKRGVYLAVAAAALAACGENWYKGNLHMHSLWSDGNVFPEDAAMWYRDHGYHFVCLSDHQILQLNPEEWLEIGSRKLSKAQADQYIANHPASVRVKKEGDKSFVRLLTIWELKRMLDQPEAFLMIPGHEVNRVIGGLQVHANVINVRDTIPYRYGATALETFARLDTALRTWGAEQDVPTLFMLNHPTWPCYDIGPDVLIALPQIRFFELCNADGGNEYPTQCPWYTLEKFWDIVNAFRIEDGYDAVFGTATDDTHNYTDPKANARPGEGWICVRAGHLDCDALVQAMWRGDFYASTGATLEVVDFDAATGTLKVKAAPECGAGTVIRFTTTKAGFDRTAEPFEDPARDKKPARKGLRYSDGIGRDVKTVDGLEASYTMETDDLYVRATVVSSRRTPSRVRNEPEFETAWTQPYGWRLWQARNPEKARLKPLK